MLISVYEIIGIIGTIVILIGFIFNDVVKIRIFNLVGSILFVIYGVFIHAWSTAILNGAMCIVNGMKLIQYYYTTKIIDNFVEEKIEKYK